MNKAMCTLLIGLNLGGLLNTALAAATPDVSVLYRGNLVAEPCTLLPEDENILLDFGTVIDKYLYLNGRTNGKAFQLHLIDCDISLGKTLKMTFNGPESAVLPGLLALDGGSQATGVAIGMETAEGQLLPLNKQTGAYPLTDGNNVISLQAYVRGEPEAIKNKAIGRGAFTAIATFVLDYE
ncbi:MULTISPECIES: fimbrial protein [unclassified Serratia (in: enterobacteria)]|uniref:fimbrial protein n=1 Tax=unclassified Serratia (in: enterobacteria) TaxID=2647522 RepID=UPI002ED503F2|nr:fimbrial protein [Serratia sp. C2(2)]MEE4449664.1 fimbrial protein [Serratia sp. C2(1)]